MELTGRVVVMTGGTRIGTLVATTLAKAGADVVLVYHHSRPEADETAAAVRALGRRSAVVQADVSDAADCVRVVESAVAEFGRLDVLVNMASLYTVKPFDELMAADWDRQLAVDLRAAFLLAKAAIPIMRKQGGGRIINFSDWIAASGRPRFQG